MAKNIDKMQFTNSKKRDNWEQIKLKDIAVKRNKKNKDSSISTVFSNSALNGIVEQKDFFDKKIANKDNLSSYFIVEKDDFVYNPRISSMAPCGPIHRNNTNKTGLVSPLYTVFRMDPKKCSLDYFEQYFKSSCWHKYMYSIANYGARSDRMNITDSDFFNMEIKAPQLIEQEKISSILTIWDKAIELKEKLIEQKKEQKKGLMQKLLTGEVRLPGFEDKWKKVYLKDVVIGKGSYGINAASVERRPELPTYLRITDITDEGNIITKGLQSVDHPDSSKYFLEENDIVFARTGASTGKSYLYKKTDGRLVYAGFLIKFSIDTNKAVPQYIKFCTQTEEYHHWVKVMSMRSGQPGINAEEYSKLPIYLPPINEQFEIAKILTNLDREILLLKKENDFLRNQMKGLMQLLLTGKVRVQV